jgi:hypothetical protein
MRDAAFKWGIRSSVYGQEKWVTVREMTKY